MRRDSDVFWVSRDVVQIASTRLRGVFDAIFSKWIKFCCTHDKSVYKANQPGYGYSSEFIMLALASSCYSRNGPRFNQDKYQSMIVPFITLLKLVALASIKLIFLLLGIAFFPVFALRLILGGATSMLLPTLSWLVENGRLDADRHLAIVNDLDELSNIDLNRNEARLLLWKLIKKTIGNLRQTLHEWGIWISQQFSKLKN